MANKDVDTRIVEMQFNSEDFDKNIRKSTKNLEDFKKELNFDDAVGQMKNVVSESSPLGNAITSMANNMKKLTNQIAGVGSISTFVAQKFKHAWESAANSVERFAKSLTTEQIDEGMKKYDKLLKSVQTIKNATGDTEEVVYDVMDGLMKYTDQTSYNFADMAQNIGKFTTVGIKLKDAETAMEGIANWAAFAGQGAAEASRAMFNISQAMSAGSMQKLDWKSIQNAAMDTRKFREEAINAGVAIGTLVKKGDKFFTKKGNKEVNLDNFVETLKFKWFDKDTMMKVFSTFADKTKGIGEEAYKAAQRCTTFNDALGAWKDMLSSGWMQTYQTVFGKLSDAMGLFSGICDKVSDSLAYFMDIRNDLLGQWSADGGRESLWGMLVGELETPDGDTLFKGAYGILDGLQDLGNAISQGFWDFVSRFADSDINKELIRTDPTKGAEFLGHKLAEVGEKVRNFIGQLKDFLFAIPAGETESRFDKITHAAEALFAVITMIGNVTKEAVKFVFGLIQQLAPAFQVIESLFSGIFQILTGSIEDGIKGNGVGSFFQGLLKVLKPVTDIINVIALVLGKAIAYIIKYVSLAIELAKKTGFFQFIALKIQSAFMTLRDKLVAFLNSGVLQMIMGWVVKAIAKIPSLVTWIKEFSASISNSVKGNKKLQSFFATIRNVFSGQNLKSILTNVKNWIKQVITKIPSIFSGAAGGIGGFFNTIFDGFLGLFMGSAKADAPEEVAEALVQPIIELGKGDVIEKAVEEAKPGILDKLKTKIGSLWQTVKDFFASLSDNEALTGIKTFFDNVKTFFSGTTFMGLLEGAKDLMKWLAIFKTGSGIGQMGKGIKSLGKGIKVFGKNLKNLNLQNIFSNMFNISNIINSNNDDHSITKNLDFSKLGPQLLEIAGAVFVLTLAAKDLIAMKDEDLKKAGISLGILLTGLLTASFIAKKVAGNGASLLAISAALWLILKPMQALANIPLITTGNQKGLIMMVGKLALLMGAIALAARVAGNVQVKGLVGLGIAVNLLLIPLQVLSRMGGFIAKDEAGKIIFDPSNPLLQAISALTVLMLAIGGTAKLANGKAKGLVSIAIALNLLMIPLKIIAGMDGLIKDGKFNAESPLLKAVSVLSLLMLEIGILVQSTDGKEVGKLAGLVGAIAVLSAIGFLIGKTVSWEQALVGFGPIILMLGMMSVLFSQASKMNVEQIKALKVVFVSFAVALAAISGCIIALGMLDIKESLILEFFGGLIVMLGVMARYVKNASKMKQKEIINAGIVIALLVIPIAAVTASLILISKENIDWKVIAAFTAGLTALIVGIGIALPKLGKLNPKEVVTGIIALAGAVVAIMGAIALMLPVVMGAVGSAISNMAARLSSMSGLLVDFFGRMNKIDMAMVQHAIDVFEKIGVMIAKFAGYTGYESDLRSVLSELNSLGTGLDLLFLNEGKYPDPKNSKTFQSLNMIIDISPKLKDVSIGDFAGQAMYLGTGLALFDYATKGLTDPEVNNGFKMMDKLKDVGDSLKVFEIGDFARNALYAGAGLSTFNRATANVADPEKSHAFKTLNMLKELGNTLTAFTVGDFARNALRAGTGLGSFNFATKGLSDPDQSNAFKTLDKLKDLGSTLASFSIGNFATDVMYLGTGLGLFNFATAGITDPNPIALELLRGIFGQAENIKTFVNLPINDFAGQMSGLGGAMSLYAKGAEAVTGLKANSDNGEMPDISGSVEILKKVCEAIAGENDNNPLVIPDNIPDGTELGLFAGQLEALGMALSTFATASNSMTGSSDKAIELLRLLGEMGGYLTKDNLEATKSFEEAEISGGDDGPLGQFALDIAALGNALGQFGALTESVAFKEDTLKTLDRLSDLKLKLSAHNLEVVKSFSNAEISGSGDNDPIGQFAADIAALGSALGEFGAYTDNVAFDSNTLDALDKLADIKGKLTSYKLGFVTAFKDAGIDGGEEGILGNFATDVAALGVALGEFSGLTGDNINYGDAVDALSSIADINGKLTAYKLGFTKAFEDAGVHGGTDNSILGQFALDVGALGTALGNFATFESYDELKPSIDALTALSDLQRDLTSQRLAVTKVFDSNGGIHADGVLKTFGEDIAALGRCLAAFAQSVKMDDGTQADFDHAIQAVNFLGTLQNRLPNVGGLVQVVTGAKEGFDTLGVQVEQMGQSLKNFSDKIVGASGDGEIDLKAIDDTFSVIQKILAIFNKLNEAGTEGDLLTVGDKIYVFISTLNAQVGNDLYNAIANFAKNMSTAFREVGGIDVQALAVFRDISTALSDITVLDPSLDFEYPGRMISEGIAQGIEKGQSRVVDAVVSVVTAAIDAGNKTADVHSPSKVFAQMGEYMSIGLANGLTRSTDDVGRAAEDMTQSAIDQAGLVLGAVSKALSESIDLQPTITPVLDLSNIVSAGTTLDTIFDGYGINLTNALNRAAAMAGDTGPVSVVIQNPTDLSGVRDEIATLQTEINNLNISLSRMRVVLDTGVIAGEIAPEIDRILGERGYYAYRRN